MKKSNSGEVVLTACQIQATRLNRLEYHRLQRNVDLLRENLQEHLARINREEQGLKLHFKNVVRVIKPNRAFQLWKQAHAQEIAQDEAKELIGLKGFFVVGNSLILFYDL
jgi:predicted DsbA family dithiol-disulfide isomerase